MMMMTLLFIFSSLTSISAEMGTSKVCNRWCAKNKWPWTDKCTWADCAGCNQCKPPIEDQYPHDFMKCDGQVAIQTKCMTAAGYDSISSSIQTLYNKLPTECNEDFCPQADWAGCVLRMAGHDFMDFDGQKGGADGCVNFGDLDNKGLKECLYFGEHNVSLHEAYKQYCTEVSLADFLVIAAETVMSVSRSRAKREPKSIDFKGQFRFGRKTATECVFNPPLPNPEDSCDGLQLTFINRMGLDWKETAALSGVHTLGRAQTENSGYAGFWSDPNNSRIFNNNYYVSMVAKGWMPKKIQYPNRNIGAEVTSKFDHFQDCGKDNSNGCTKVQWARSDSMGKHLDGPEMMLNTDLCLMYKNGHMEPLKASRDECCAWAHASRGYQKQLKMSFEKYFEPIYDDADQQWCGSSVRIGTNQIHKNCCAGVTWENAGNCVKDRVKGGEIDYGVPCHEMPLRMNGPAEKDIIRFAANETAWLEAFLIAWKKATEVGQVAQLNELGGGGCPGRKLLYAPADGQSWNGNRGPAESVLV